MAAEGPRPGLNGAPLLATYPAYHEAARLGARLSMSRRNLLSLLNCSSQFAGDPAVVETRGYRRDSFTYAELRSRALSWGHVLGCHGVRPGDRVLLWGSNSSAWLAGFWAILLRSAVAVPMDAGANREFVQRIVREAQVKFILRDVAQPLLSEGPPSLVYNDLEAAAASSPTALQPCCVRSRAVRIAPIILQAGVLRWQCPSRRGED